MRASSRLCHIFAGEQGAVFGGAQFGMGDTNVARQIGLGSLQRQESEITLGGSDCNPRATLAAQFEALANLQCRFSAAKALEHARPREILDLDLQFGIWRSTCLPGSRFGSGGFRGCFRNAR